MSLAECAATGSLTISGLNLSVGPAYLTPNLWALYATWDVRGSDRLLPGVNGVIPYRRRITVTTQTVELLISGHTSYTGAAVSPRTLCLEQNITHLRDVIVVPPPAHPGTRPATLVLPSGASLTGAVHVVRFEPGEVIAGWMQATLTLSIPGGRLA